MRSRVTTELVLGPGGRKGAASTRGAWSAGCFGMVALAVALLGLLIVPGTSIAQNAPPMVDGPLSVGELPDEPGQSSTSSSNAANGSISGTVQDITGATVSAATVTLFQKDRAGNVETVSGADGQFRFSGLTSGRFRLRVTAAGMRPYMSPEFDVKAGELLTVPEVKMLLEQAASDVNVTASEEQIATEQVKAEEKQRAFGVLPNFYSSYIWDAAPLHAKQKFSLALHSVADPFAFVGAGVVAGIEQATDAYHGYHQGTKGFARRFGAAYGDDGISRLLGSAVLPSVLRQDPRYFYQGSGTKKSRLRHAIASAVICRGDNGRAQVNYSYILGSFGSGAISTLYYPDGSVGSGLVIANGFLNIAGHAADDVVREFVLRRVTPKVPDYAKGRQ